MQGRAPVWDYLTSDDEQVGPGRPSDLAASREPRRVPRSQSQHSQGHRSCHTRKPEL